MMSRNTRSDLAITKKVMDLNQIPKRSDLVFTETYSEERLDQLRTRGDPAADAVIRKLVEVKGKLHNIFDLLNEVKALRDKVPEFQQFLEEAWSMPEWLNFDDMERGRRLLAIYMPYMGISLFAGSLVGGAMFQKAAVVTSMGSFSQDSTRRTEETAYMIAKMVIPDGMKPGGEGHETLVRVRLLHAALRYHLVDSGKFHHPVEVPINQQDLAITHGLFCYLNLRSLHRLNIRLSDADIQSWMTLWRYAGFLLGIDDDLVPKTLPEQQEFFMASLKHQCKPESIPEEAKLILDGIAEKASKDTYSIVPYSTIQRYLHQMTRFLSGNEYCAGMKIQDEGDYYWGIIFTKAMGTVTNVIDQYIPFGDSFLYHLHMLHMNRFFRSKKLKTSGHRAKL